jgi:hypothetical protein
MLGIRRNGVALVRIEAFIRPEAVLQELRGHGIGARASEHGALWCVMI